jgi:hypothetical protein
MSNSSEFRSIDPLVEEDFSDAVSTASESKPKAKRVNKPKLSSKHENLMVFGHWLASKKQDVDEQAIILDSLHIKDDLEEQKEFYSDYTENIKEHKKVFKNFINPKQKNAPKKKVVMNNNVEADEDEPVVEAKKKVVKQRVVKPDSYEEPEPEPVVQLKKKVVKQRVIEPDSDEETEPVVEVKKKVVKQRAVKPDSDEEPEPVVEVKKKTVKQRVVEPDTDEEPEPVRKMSSKKKVIKPDTDSDNDSMPPLEPVSKRSNKKKST